MANHDNDFWKSRLESADPVEIRLDATLAACHSLARYLAYDMSLPPKAIPGFEVADIVMLVNTFTSALVLAMIWTLVGLGTRLFEAATQEMQSWSRLALTTLVAGPLWLILELLFNGLLYQMEMHPYESLQDRWDFSLPWDLEESFRR
ncbi:hypothetical protein MHU86_7663 [Fragilaria crotonensis]|nr:hypothetical protein MHU86_7663 [Fragilaria crotonensis]